MKSYLWSLIQRYFQTELKAFSERFKMDHYREVNEERQMDKTYVNYPLGKKVILRSNEPGPITIGTVVGYEEIKNKVFLKIKDEKTGEVVSSLNNTPPYWNPSREKILMKLNWCEQWNILTHYDTEMDEEHQKYKESPEYLNRTQNNQFEPKN